MFMRHRSSRAALLATAGLVGALALTGCSAFEDAGDDQTLRVAAAFYPLQYVAERVAGDLAEVDPVVAATTEPHDADMSVKATAAVARADLVLLLGGFQPAVDDAAEQNATGTVLDAADAVDLRPVTDAEDHAHGEDGHDSADDDHADHDEHDHDHDEHDHGDDDPHFWHDPLLVADLGDRVAEELAEIAPEHADEFAANAAALRGDLEALDADYTEALSSCERKTVVVSHDAFGYLRRYGLDFHAVAGLSPDAEPTPADLSRLQKLIGETGITTVLSERLAPARLTQTLADDLGLRTDVLDPVEGLTEETADEDYLSLMRANLAVLQEANECR